MKKPTYPFSALVGQSEMVDALLVGLLCPRLGGVLLRGHRGSAKTTAARALAELIQGPFVEVPLNTSPDRLLGGLELSQALQGRWQAQPGLLEQAHGGVLYVDEINLLPPQLLNDLLGAASEGEYCLERDGLSRRIPSRFLLIGSMNPEERELSPQLLDRFGLSVEIRTPSSAQERMQVVRRWLDFERDAVAFADHWKLPQRELGLRVTRAREICPELPEELRKLAVDLCLAHAVEGHRADVCLCLAARAWASWLECPSVLPEHLRRVSDWVLNHRTRQAPEPAPSAPPPPTGGQPPQANPAEDQPADSSQSDGRGDAPEQTFGAGDPSQFQLQLDLPEPNAARPTAGGKQRLREAGSRGREWGDAPLNQAHQPHRLALSATLRQAMLTRPGQALPLQKEDLRVKRRQRIEHSTVVFLLDSSGSMGSQRVMEASKALLLHWFLHSYQKRNQVGLVAVTRGQSQVLLPISRSLERARQALQDLVTGGRSPLGQGLRHCRELLRGVQGSRKLVVISDGRCNLSSSPGVTAQQELQREVERLVADEMDCLLVDTEQGGLRLGLLKQLSERLGGVIAG